MSAPWVKASQVPKIPGTNAHAGSVTPVVGLWIKFSWWTVGIVFALTITIVVLSAKGIAASWLLRRTKARLRDNKVHARPVFIRRRMQRMASTEDVGMQILRSDQ
jgi:hypothetical protein